MRDDYGCHSIWSTFLLLKNLRKNYGCHFNTLCKSSGKRSMQIRNNLPSSSAFSLSKNDHKWYSEYICPSTSMESHLGGLLNAVKRHQRGYSKAMQKYIYNAKAVHLVHNSR